MPQYIVSALKYRPDSFSSLIGQDNIAKTLKNSIIKGRLAHAYLFCGPRGVGKTSAARIFAKTINCSNPGKDMEPCGECESCVSFKEGRSYCIHELDAASNNGVDDIKALMEQVQIPPQVGKYSVYIIDEVHMLSQAAFNAFLKTLEEPPEYAIFILATTEKHKVLPTILSRCQTYDFNRISIPDMVKNLKKIAKNEGVKIDEESLHVIARKADGAMRDALTIFDQTIAFCGKDIHCEEVMKNLNVLNYDYMFNMVDSFLAGDYIAAMTAFNDILSKGFNALHFVSSLSGHFRDLIVCKNGGSDSLLELPDSLKKKYQEQALKCDIRFLYSAIETTMSCEAGYKASVNPRLHIEFHLMKLAYINAGFASGKKDARRKQHQATSKQDVQQSAQQPAQQQVQQPAKQTVSQQEAPQVVPQSVQQPAQQSVQQKPQQVVQQPAQQSVPQPVPQPTQQQVQNVAGPQTSIQSQKVEEKNPIQSSEVVQSEESEELKRRKARRMQRKKASKVGETLGIKTILTEHQSNVLVEEKKIDEHDKIPTDEEVTTAWDKMINEFSSKPRLAATLRDSELKMEEKDGLKHISFSVLNKPQKIWIEQKQLFEIEETIIKIAGSSKIKLSIFVKPLKQTEVKKYRPEEQLKEIVSDNKEVLNLIDDIGLGLQ